MVMGSLGARQDNDGVKEAAPLTAWARCTLPYHGACIIDDMPKFKARYPG